MHTRKSVAMNPYETDPTAISPSDLYGDSPLYGRYVPHGDDFQPDLQHSNSTSPESLKYWESILESCDWSNRLHHISGARDVFALGSVIVKSGHLSNYTLPCDHSLADQNEVSAVALVREVLEGLGIQVPMIYFAGKLRGWDVLIESRIPGVTLNVAWPYLSSAQKASFKAQARKVLHQTFTLPSPPTASSYVVQDSDPFRGRRITELEQDLLFGNSTRPGDGVGNEEDLGIMHNNLTQSNIIVDNDMIIGVIGWDMAGYFGWKCVGAVHSECRVINRQCFANLKLEEERLADLTYWNDLYAVDPANL